MDIYSTPYLKGRFLQILGSCVVGKVDSIEYAL